MSLVMNSSASVLFHPHLKYICLAQKDPARSDGKSDKVTDISAGARRDKEEEKVRAGCNGKKNLPASS